MGLKKMIVGMLVGGFAGFFLVFFCDPNRNPAVAFVLGAFVGLIVVGYSSRPNGSTKEGDSSAS